jgi:DNA invertase Pin-like site-specific DNA recombinase
MMKYVAYYRVSTRQQGNSGLGLQAQKQIVMQHLKPQDSLVAEFIEVETGKNNYRPQLTEAIEHTKEVNATLIIAKLDRLSRNAAFIFQLRDTKVPFVCCDIPEANTLTIGIFATMAQHERETVSARTKAALAAKKRQGFKLGTPGNLTEAARQKSIEVRKDKARRNTNNRRAEAMIKELRSHGMSYQKIAEKLNDNGFKTSRGNKFSAKQVQRLADRSKNEEKRPDGMIPRCGVF